MRGGKALRDKLPLEQHGEWKEFEGRTTPIGILRKFDAGRMKELVPIRYGRMLQSPFAFYRGAAGVMASDLSRTPHTGLTVHACGDCHLMNFGGFATPERNIIFDINDFDETSPAPWEWDVKRLVARSCSRHDRSACPTARAVIALRLLHAATASTCGNSAKWTHFEYGTRTSAPKISLVSSRRLCRKVSGSGSTGRRRVPGQSWTSQSSRGSWVDRFVSQINRH
jgi:hypothetical protein